jgi:hypothetical protein
MRTPAFTDPRLRREAKTLRELIRLYCRRNHGHDEAPCLECVALESYALERLDHCPFGGQKPVCSLCPSQCYRQRERDAIRRVMRHAGPRLIWSHPLLSLRHIIDRLRSRRGLAQKNAPLDLTASRPKQE